MEAQKFDGVRGKSFQMKVVEARSPPMMDAEKMFCEEFLSFVPRTLTIILKGEVSPKPDLLSLLVKTSFFENEKYTMQAEGTLES